MSEFEHLDDGSGFESSLSLESIVRAAGDYIQPTDDLRPRTLEAAREASNQRRWNYCIGTMAMATILIAICGLLGPATSSRAGQITGPAQAIRAFDLHQEASVKQASLPLAHAGFDSSWAMYEAFFELRKQQADLFDAAK